LEALHQFAGPRARASRFHIVCLLGVRRVYRRCGVGSARISPKRTPGLAPSGHSPALAGQRAYGSRCPYTALRRRVAAARGLKGAYGRGRLDAFVALTVPTICSLACCASRPFRQDPPGRGRRRGPGDANCPRRSARPTRRRARLAAASHERHRATPQSARFSSTETRLDGPSWVAADAAAIWRRRQNRRPRPSRSCIGAPGARALARNARWALLSLAVLLLLQVSQTAGLGCGRRTRSTPLGRDQNRRPRPFLECELGGSRSARASPKRTPSLALAGDLSAFACQAVASPDLSNCRVHRGDESAKLIVRSKA
jgi:hypothetical protein